MEEAGSQTWQPVWFDLRKAWRNVFIESKAIHGREGLAVSMVRAREAVRIWRGKDRLSVWGGRDRLSVWGG